MYTKYINECDNKSSISCYGNCINTEGSYNCTCWPGYTGNAKTVDGCQPVAKGVAKGSQFPVMIFTLVAANGVAIKMEVVSSGGAHCNSKKRNCVEYCLGFQG
ncbi:EGF-like calcium-binding domain-containing protein [Artemisia annua]|uniref:EGF-like calcium-binding domain-containing protein n=1 Tax=Artemisia annua TaxID=35608 RepID=A0A2U1QC08_ARTAN|nr:EGF-like calcium-binding domain-containing protein [Artemisia annua]